MGLVGTILEFLMQGEGLPQGRGGLFNSLTTSPWENAVVAGGGIVETVNQLKAQSGGDLIAYGGGTLVSSTGRMPPDRTERAGMRAHDQGYASVSGLSMYYEVHDDGPPTVLMQRAGHYRRRLRAPPAPLAASRRVIAVGCRDTATPPTRERNCQDLWMACHAAR